MFGQISLFCLPIRWQLVNPILQQGEIVLAFVRKREKYICVIRLVALIYPIFLKKAAAGLHDSSILEGVQGVCLPC
jgi:hypothetical protein